MNELNYKEYTERAFSIASHHGFHDKTRPLQHYLMLVISEVSEMVEAERKRKYAQVAMFKQEVCSTQDEKYKKSHWQFCFENFIKDSVEDEMADACIRLFDLAGAMGFVPDRINLDHLGSQYLDLVRLKAFTEKAYGLCQWLTTENGDNEHVRIIIEVSLAYLECWAKSEGIDLEWHINQKMKYNEMRPRLHGKKY